MTKYTGIDDVDWLDEQVHVLSERIAELEKVLDAAISAVDTGDLIPLNVAIGDYLLALSDLPDTPEDKP